MAIHGNQGDMGHLMREAIRGNPWHSVVISGHQWSSLVISGHQWPSEVLTWNGTLGTAARSCSRRSQGHS